MGQSPVSFAPDPNGHTDFAHPSGNIACIYIPAGGTRVYKPKDGGPELSCDQTGSGGAYRRYALGKSGGARIIQNPNEQDCCGSNNTLAQGARWAAGPFSCESTLEGVNCNRNDGSGFSINAKGGGRAYPKPK